ncbi:hypothetical protein EW146_g7309 [Bondarzewia mesenterica]|uniref:glutamate--tRNA ligase n=1 Tax=Bondarzewia mesenterica TaxID=1095465 RepID=A0A4S4LRS3_9AGAM|nr:hypothetical protein EW146_g7309 [Bondarzewia mesenterica]
MELGSHFPAKLEPFVLMSKSAKGAAAAKLIQDATSAPGVYVFAELLEAPNVQELSNNEQHAQFYLLLKLFAYKTYQDYLQHKDKLPPLSAAQITKLKHLSLVSFAMERRILPYTDLLQALELSSIRELEDLIIDAIYLDVLRGKLDQKEQQFEVEYTMGRDVEPDKVGSLLQALEDWSSTTSSVLSALDSKLASLASQRVARKAQEEEHERILTENLMEVQEQKSEAKAVGKRSGVGRKERDDDRMDIDEPENSKGKSRNCLGPRLPLIQFPLNTAEVSAPDKLHLIYILLELAKYVPTTLSRALHLGGLRTALFNHLYARKLGGKWILRIEDTDATRAVPGAMDGIREMLHWAGLEYDFGPGKNGPHGSYFQSERLDLYHSYAKKLLDTGHAYRCFCSADELTTTRERLARSGLNSTYDKKCLNLTEEEVARRVRAGEKFIVRHNDSNLPHRTTPADLIFGHVRDAHASLPTDPVLLKSDQFPTYHLASVVDDHEMGITHVLRGEEWLPSLPLHLDLYASLAVEPPQFAHLPLLLNKDGSKMSKRNGDMQVADYMRRGWEPDAVLNWLALAGWGVYEHSHPTMAPFTTPSTPLASSLSRAAPDSTAIMSLSEMIERFDLSVLTHRRTVLDPSKLEYISKHHLVRLASTEDGLNTLAERAHSIVKEVFPDSDPRSRDLIQGRLINVNELPASAPYFFTEPEWSSTGAQTMLKHVPNSDYRNTLNSVIRWFDSETVKWDRVEIAGALHYQNDLSGIKSKVFMTALRHALTGMKSGPSVPELMHTMGLERSVSRLTRAEAKSSEWFNES